MDLSIIIVSWNVKDRLKANLEKLFSSRIEADFEVFVVDNDSKDRTPEMIENCFPKVELIRNEENLGFARANNQAIKRSKGRYILLLNPDMEIYADTLDDMVRWMDGNERSDIAGCKLVDENGGLIKHVRNFPNLADQLAIILKLPHIFPSVLDSYIIKDFDYEKASQVQSIRGGFFMIRRGSLKKILPEEKWKKLEVLDERYFLWFEEVDLCRQTIEAGGEVWYTPKARCRDHVGQSFKQVSGLKKQRYFRDSMIKYFIKWQPAWQAVVLKTVWPIGLMLTRMLDMLGVKGKGKT
ncbi:glycosyltransferase [Candidatus Falkowbacteria bacterium]|nr:glycosyltransferase [Candidatus Falkowbacteria bacterium]